MNFLLHIREPAFHCVQGRRFLGVRGGYNCRVTFPDRRCTELNKMLSSKENLSLRVTPSYDPGGQPEVYSSNRVAKH